VAVLERAGEIGLRRALAAPPAQDKAEIVAAVADVSCKIRTDLPNTWLAVEAAYQQAAIGQNMTTLAALQTRFQRQLQHLEPCWHRQADGYGRARRGDPRPGGPGRRTPDEWKDGLA
jgi:hypothetical protein